MPEDSTNKGVNSINLQKKLWVYTNYDCNLRCSYCLVESSPKAARRAISLDFVKRLVDEAYDLEFEHIFFTGGEPFILVEIYEMLAYASQKIQTTVLTNATLLYGERLEKLEAIQNDQLTVQVSLDSNRPEGNDPYRGKNSWAKTMRGLQALIDGGFRVRLATTETEVNSAYLDELCTFHLALGIPEENHLVRKLARRGSSQEGLEVGKHNLAPEITINLDGVYWHPLSTDPDFRVSDTVFPLAQAVGQVKTELLEMSSTSQTGMKPFE